MARLIRDALLHTSVVTNYADAPSYAEPRGRRTLDERPALPVEVIRRYPARQIEAALDAADGDVRRLVFHEDRSIEVLAEPRGSRGRRGLPTAE